VRPAEGRDLDADAVLHPFLAKVAAPGPDRDDHVDGVLLRKDPHGAVPDEGQRPDVAGVDLVHPDGLEDRLAELLAGEGAVHLEDVHRTEEPVNVLFQAEDRGTRVRLVAADALEDAGAVMQGVREHMHLRVVPGNELPVHPDLFRCLKHRRIL
jgi:hypothetical protein